MYQSRVLIVDDDPFARVVVSKRIEQLGAAVVVAADGMEALDALKSGTFDLAVVDLEMPRLDGYELLGCIRGLPNLKHLPVIVLTGRDDRASLEKALTCGATSFLIKPLNWLAFSAHIEHLMHLSKAARQLQGLEQAKATG
jgi:CheY-like chemotaxis protein